jgi:hypothetical protein
VEDQLPDRLNGSGHSLWCVQDNGRKGREDRVKENDGQMAYTVAVNIRVNH